MTKFDAILKFANQVINAEGVVIGAPIVIDEITFVPIIKEGKPKEERDYLTLSEALDQGLAKIIEKGTEIQHIIFENKGDVPILIEEGEIFLGQGTQDRICVSTVMVQPDSRIEVPVKCVHAPHMLAAGANFMYGGKSSRQMLGNIREMKYRSSFANVSPSTISQTAIWNGVQKETAFDTVSSDKSQYTQTIGTRMKVAQDRSEKVKFPQNTIGLGVVNQEGKVRGLEIHRSPHNFKVRKAGFFTTLEGQVEWNKGKKPISTEEAKEKILSVFKRFKSMKEGKEIRRQIDVDGLVINLDDGITGEVFSSSFYSDVCPECGSKKKRVSKCTNCGFVEESEDEFAYMSLL